MVAHTFAPGVVVTPLSSLSAEGGPKNADRLLSRLGDGDSGARSGRSSPRAGTRSYSTQNLDPPGPSAINFFSNHLTEFCS